MTPFTHHARQRLSHRNISPSDVAFALRHGRVSYRTGIRFVFLGRRDLPRGCERSHEHLVGITVLQAVESGCIITVYRNPLAVRAIKRLPAEAWRGRPGRRARPRA
ncbi:MAG: DUF4258 domain-containing protein [Candidatus Sericytochromatia bacterium]|nr:DUF4258 domain-containing protein [Candidatus Sericytochromatia bacterium]